MERRGFLKGIFGGVTAAGLIINAKPAALEAFTAPLVKDAPLIIDPYAEQSPEPLNGMQALYNARGEMIGVVTSISVHSGSFDTHSYESGFQSYMPGLHSFKIELDGLPGVRFDAGRELRGPLRR